MNDDRAKIAVVEDDRILRQQITWSLKSDYQISEAGSRDEAMGIMRTESPDLVLLDMHLPPSGRMEEGLSLIREARRTGTDTVFIMMSGSDSQESAQKAIREGAYDFFRKPFDLSELRLIIQRALDRLRIERENRQLRQELQSRYAFRNIIGSSPAMRRVFEAIRKVSESSTSVMLRGESGTGKELVARAVHFNSPRRDGRFIGVNCGAIPATLVESELFGHERGAFTGAISEREGRFELAHEGTLFLDEVGTLSLDLQTRLLRVVETRQFERVGGTRTHSTDFRLITATNEDLEASVAKGTFREDLYYRLKVFPIHLPPLRERKEDIPLLVDHFLRKASREHGLPLKQIDTDALSALVDAAWKGNVRELENLIQTVVLMVDGNRILRGDLPSHLGAGSCASFSPANIPPEGLSLMREVERYELSLILAALDSAGGVKAEAAKLLGVDKNRMMYLCRKYRLAHRVKDSSSEG